MVFVVVGFLYLPLLGTFSLWDPWETHYGEVAREMISRDDWISLWWAQENWFWSKPILIFWSEAFTLSALGVDCSPDANPAHPEWAIRLPVVMFSIAAVLVAYATIKRFFGARAGVLAALALATVPHFFFLAHQAITDMYLVANLVIAMCLLALAMATEPEAVGRRVRVLGRCWSGQALVAFLLLLVGLPQALYLISRNVRFFPTEGFAFVEDVFLYGSGGNPGGIGEGQVPGNPELRDTHPAVDGLLGQPFLQGLFWLVGLAIVVWWIRREARKQGPLDGRLLRLLRTRLHGQDHPRPRHPRRRRALLPRRLAALGPALRRSAAGRARRAHRARDRHAVVRRDVRPPRHRLHRPPPGARQLQPPRGGRARRHGQRAVLPVAARLRALPLGRPGARGGPRLALDARPQQRRRPAAEDRTLPLARAAERSGERAPRGIAARRSRSSASGS
ncbi:MAG: glycosyltransferase family 39 protein [Sandaracinus sp.]|nr:glycosyltransferase family 39 protein [Sandaracinus sp.]